MAKKSDNPEKEKLAEMDSSHVEFVEKVVEEIEDEEDPEPDTEDIPPPDEETQQENQLMEEVSEPSVEVTKPIKILKRQPEKEVKKKLVLEKKVKEKKEARTENEVEVIKFEDNDFPALGKEDVVEAANSVEVPHIRILARKGNQKQRREEQKERMGAQSVMEEKLSIFHDMSIPRSVILSLISGKIRRCDEKT